MAVVCVRVSWAWSTGYGERILFLRSFSWYLINRCISIVGGGAPNEGREREWKEQKNKRDASGMRGVRENDIVKPHDLKALI